MAGGLLNLVAVGNQNVFLTGNPKKTFFTSILLIKGKTYYIKELLDPAIEYLQMGIFLLWET